MTGDSPISAKRLHHRRRVLRFIPLGLAGFSGCLANAESNMKHSKTPIGNGWRASLSPPMVTDELYASFDAEWGEVLIDKDRHLERVEIEPGHVAVLFDLHLSHEDDGTVGDERDVGLPSVGTWALHEDHGVDAAAVRHWSQFDAVSDAKVLAVPGDDERDIHHAYGHNKYENTLCYEVEKSAESLTLFHDPELEDVGMDQASARWSFDLERSSGWLGWLP